MFAAVVALAVVAAVVALAVVLAAALVLAAVVAEVALLAACVDNVTLTFADAPDAVPVNSTVSPAVSGVFK